MKRNVLTASAGTVLTDGLIFGKEIYLAEGGDESAFYEISEEEYKHLQEKAQAALVY